MIGSYIWCSIRDDGIINDVYVTRLDQTANWRPREDERSLRTWHIRTSMLFEHPLPVPPSDVPPDRLP